MWPKAGGWVKVVIKGDTSFQGQVFQVDESLGIAIIMRPIVPPDYSSLPAPLRPAINHTLQILALSSIVSVTETTGPEDQVALPDVRPIKVERLMRREQRAMQKRQSVVDGVAPSGASQEAVAIYTALAKT
jgi:hypothetical protein